MTTNGVQRATVTTKRCPMYDEVCAAKVAERLAAMYPGTSKPCDCTAADDSLRAFLERSGLSAEVIAEALATAWTPEQKAQLAATVPTQHHATCASHTVETVDAMKLIEEKCGRYTRGQHKGQLRGWAEMAVVTEGGWKKYGPGERNGRVVRPGQVLGIKIGDSFSGKTYLEV